MARRCCCGKIVFEDEDGGLVINDYEHEIFGPDGAFCGPVIKHQLRNLLRENARLMKRETELMNEVSGKANMAALLREVLVLLPAIERRDRHEAIAGIVVMEFLSRVRNAVLQPNK